MSAVSPPQKNLGPSLGRYRAMPSKIAANRDTRKSAGRQPGMCSAPIPAIRRIVVEPQASTES
jgi:hypothetical protein